MLELANRDLAVPVCHHIQIVVGSGDKSRDSAGQTFGKPGRKANCWTPMSITAIRFIAKYMVNGTASRHIHVQKRGRGGGCNCFELGTHTTMHMQVLRTNPLDHPDQELDARIPGSPELPWR